MGSRNSDKSFKTISVYPRSATLPAFPPLTVTVLPFLSSAQAIMQTRKYLTGVYFQLHLLQQAQSHICCPFAVLCTRSLLITRGAQHCCGETPCVEHSDTHENHKEGFSVCRHHSVCLKCWAPA